MFPYYCLIFLPVLTGLIQSNGIIRIGYQKKRDDRNTAITVFFWLFFILLSLRDRTCGADLQGYAWYFAQIGEFCWQEALTCQKLERGYVLLNKLVSLFTSSYQVLLCVIAFLSTYPLLWFYRKEAEIPILTMVLFATVAPFSMYFSGLRQITAMAFAIPAWYCAQNKKFLRFIFLVCVAACFHRTAFVLLLIYPLYHIRITQKRLMIVIPVMVLIYLYKGPLFGVLAGLFWEEADIQVTNTGATTVLILLVLFAAYSFIIPEERKLDKDVNGYRNILLLTVVIQCFAPVHNLAMRMNYYFLPFVPVLVPKIANRSKKQFKNAADLSVVVMTLFFTVYFFWNAYTGADILLVYPYVPFWRG